MTGHTVTSNGYIMTYVGKNHHLAHGTGYAYEHRVVAEKILGRRLRKGEVVHHKDENRKNNDPLNIEVTGSIGDHKGRHRKDDSNLQAIGEINNLVICGCGCGGMFAKFDNMGRPRVYLTGHNRKGRGKMHDKTLMDCECGCGEKLTKYDKYGRERKFISGHKGRRNGGKYGNGTDI